ncbi:hypothetical protein OE88DRAFT_1736818 [Heliocybe sulcata]|uniref:Cyanovirin-N domain-containing protein n=1 Tax=Heliocybe sulcata TaxID=5364 RepID=A0A5C3MWG1_9AGAM|nr:hypothetical protein OE88DRAFT_1736818 [Heliocybe sulcata]
MQLSLTLAVSSLALILQLQATGANFASTCTTGYISGDTFHSSCYNDAGQLVDTSINLNNCVANYDGQLTCVHGNGGYSSTCSGCEIAAGIEYMECYCSNGSGGSPASIVDLGQYALFVFVPPLSAE